MGKIAVSTYKDVKGADAAIANLLGQKGKGKLDAGFDVKPDAAAKKGDKDGAAKAKQLSDFWTKLESDLDLAKLFGLELEKRTKELELQKILGRDINAAEKERVDRYVQNIAQEKAITDLKKSAFELAIQNNLLAARALGLRADAHRQRRHDQQRHCVGSPVVEERGRYQRRYQQHLHPS